MLIFFFREKKIVKSFLCGNSTKDTYVQVSLIVVQSKFVQLVAHNTLWYALRIGWAASKRNWEGRGPREGRERHDNKHDMYSVCTQNSRKISTFTSLWLSYICDLFSSFYFCLPIFHKNINACLILLITF